MKKILLISAFFISSCFGQCNKGTVDPSPTPVTSSGSIVVDSGLNPSNDLDANPTTEQDSAVKESVVNFNGMEITYPLDFEKVENEIYSFVGVDPNRKLLLILNSENFDSTYDHYVLSKIRVLRNDNVKINDIDYTVINGIKFSFVKSSKNQIHSWHLYTFKNKVGYEINCGGPLETNIDNACMDIIKTVTFTP